MIPLLPVWIISSFCACVLSYCRSFLPLWRKWSATKGFLDFCVAICLITTGEPGIGTGKQVPDCLSVQRCKYLITGAKGHNFNMRTHTHIAVPARCNILTVVDHSGAHPCMFILWLKGVLIYVFSILHIYETLDFSFFFFTEGDKYWFFPPLSWKDRHAWIHALLLHPSV